VEPGCARTGQIISAHYLWYDYPYSTTEYDHLAMAAEWSSFRFSFTQGHLEQKAFAEISEYTPAGVDSHMRVYGLSADLSSLLIDPISPTRISLGFNYRQYTDDGNTSDTNSFDLGLLGSRSWSVHAGNWLGVRAGIMLQNVTDRTVLTYEIKRGLGQDLRYGLVLEGGLPSATVGRDLCAFLLSYSGVQSVGRYDTDRYECDNFGLELRFMDTIALRGGHNNKLFHDSSPWTWGAGLNVELLTMPVLGLTIDYARIDGGFLTTDELQRFQLGLQLLH
jgi:hypothetical protein